MGLLGFCSEVSENQEAASCSGYGAFGRGNKCPSHPQPLHRCTPALRKGSLGVWTMTVPAGCRPHPRGMLTGLTFLHLCVFPPGFSLFKRLPGGALQEHCGVPALGEGKLVPWPQLARPRVDPNLQPPLGSVGTNPGGKAPGCQREPGFCFILGPV